jgi:hypothetical protein
MQDRYQSAERASKTSLDNRWDEAVSNAVRRGRFPEGVSLTLGFSPSEQQLDAWSSEKYKATVSHMSGWTVEAYSNEYGDHFQERTVPSSWTVRLKAR